MGGGVEGASLQGSPLQFARNRKRGRSGLGNIRRNRVEKGSDCWRSQ